MRKKHGYLYVIFTAILLMLAFSALCSAEREDITITKKGIDLYNAGKYDDAIEQFDQAVYLNADNFYASEYLGLIYLKRDDKESALEQFERAYNINPSPKLRKYVDDLKAKVVGPGKFMLYPLSFEVDMGLAMTYSYGNSVDLYSMVFTPYSFSAFGFVTYHATEWLGFSTGLMLDQYSGTFDSSSYYSYDYKANYVELPAMVNFRIRTPFSDNAEVLVGAGLFYGFATNTSLTGGTPGDGISIAPTETGAVIQTGVGYSFGKICVTLTEFFNLGFSSVINGVDVKEMNYSTTIGIEF